MLAALLTALVLQTAPQSAEQQAAAGTLDRMHDAAARADGKTYFDLFTPDARFIGTDATERWSLPEFRAYAMPYFSRGQGWTYRPHDRVLTLAPGDCRCLVWFDELLDNDAYGLTRGSGVLRLTDDGWKIEQYVLSFTVPNDRARDVVEVVRRADQDRASR